MLWEKKSLKEPEKRGYLYLRETLYIRDKRSHIRKPKKLGSGKAYFERGKYSKKKDIYCGKIIEIAPVHFLTFENYIEKIGYSYLEYKLNVKFNELVDGFVNYLLYIHEITAEMFNSKPKKAFELGSGYLCQQTIDFLKSFTVRHNEDNKRELERFAFRCEDAGIYDTDVIATLYTKIMPAVDESIKEELEELKKHRNTKKQFQSFRDFVKGQYE